MTHQSFNLSLQRTVTRIPGLALTANMDSENSLGRRMNDYIFLMHNDATSEGTDAAWSKYLEDLRATGQFDGGSAIGSGECVKKSKRAPPISSHLSGYIRVHAENLESAKQLLKGNPVFEAGGSVEIRELLRE